jgi:ribonuclease Z
MISGVRLALGAKTKLMTIVFDCADGTLARLMQSPLRVANITRIFITHMHADHVLGLVWVLTHIMSGIGTTPEDTEKLKAKGLGKKVWRRREVV